MKMKWETVGLSQFYQAFQKYQKESSKIGFFPENEILYKNNSVLEKETQLNMQKFN